MRRLPSAEFVAFCELSNDAVHPSKGGYSVMQPLAERSINEALARKP
jgi:hypothetical protein